MAEPNRRLPELIEGDGIVLRRWLESDAEALARAVRDSDAHLRPWMPWMSREPQTIEQRRAMLREREREWLAGGDVMLGVFVDGTVAGSCGLHARVGPSALELGYWIHVGWTRRGLATRAVRLLTDAAFSLPEITHVEIHTDKANLASAGVARRLGFELIAETPDEPAAPGEVGIECVWRMERARWTSAGRSATAA